MSWRRRPGVAVRPICSDLLPALRQAGWDCEAAVGRDGPLGTELTALGFSVHYVNLMERRFAPLRALRLARLTDRLAPDIVHLHGTCAAFMHAVGRTILAAVSRRAREHSPVIYTAHGLAYRKDAGLLGSQVSLLAERVACYGTQAVISVSRTDLADWPAGATSTPVMDFTSPTRSARRPRTAPDGPPRVYAWGCRRRRW